MRDQLEFYLKNQIADRLDVDVKRLDVTKDLDAYGIDSVAITDITRSLETHFPDISMTLFFEYKNITALVEYFMQAHESRVRDLFPAQHILRDAKTSRDESPVQADSKSASVGDFDWSGRFLSETFSVDPAPGFVRQTAQSSDDSIVIVGLSGRYPYASDINTFWQNLLNGRDCIDEAPARVASTVGYKRWGGFISDVDCFDPMFFNISPREAEIMDPHERLFLEQAWHAMEDAGYTRESLKIKADGSPARMGVYVGVMWANYQLFSGSQPGQTGISFSWSIANRISYQFDAHGPSMAIDTACSSSLTALHTACVAIQRGDCDLALVGGVNLSLHPLKYDQLEQGQFLSSEGRCRAFGSAGDGYVPGEGVGAMIIKRRSDALASGDHIYAEVMGTATNHGGKTNGYTVPNPTAQADVIRDALTDAGLKPEDISYIEAHGTGTALGDPVEIRGLSLVFGDNAQKGDVCAVGSVKSNIGHLEAASGMASLTKVLLQMKHGKLVASLHSNPSNEHIDFNATPFYVPQQTREWSVRGDRRYAGISSFGAGGSNAHVVLSSWAENIDAYVSHSDSRYLIPFSAKTETQLRQLVADYVGWLKDETNLENNFANMEYTLFVGREAMRYRLACVVSDFAELRDSLQAWLRGEQSTFASYADSRAVDHQSSLGHDDEEVDYVKALWNKQKLIKLAALWVNGMDLVVKCRFENRRGHRRVSLPCYPFAREPYWLQGGRLEAPVVEQRVEIIDMPSVVSRRSRSVWMPVANGGADHDKTQRIIYIGRDNTVFSLLKAALQTHGLTDCKWIEQLTRGNDKTDAQVLLDIKDTGLHAKLDEMIANAEKITLLIDVNNDSVGDDVVDFLIVTLKHDRYSKMSLILLCNMTAESVERCVRLNENMYRAPVILSLTGSELQELHKLPWHRLHTLDQGLYRMDSGVLMGLEYQNYELPVIAHEMGTDIHGIASATVIVYQNGHRGAMVSRYLSEHLQSDVVDICVDNTPVLTMSTVNKLGHDGRSIFIEAAGLSKNNDCLFEVIQMLDDAQARLVCLLHEIDDKRDLLAQQASMELLRSMIESRMSSGGRCCVLSGRSVNHELASSAAYILSLESLLMDLSCDMLFFDETRSSAIDPVKSSPAEVVEFDEHAIAEWLRKKVAGIVKAPVERINPDDNVYEYGMNSVMLLELGRYIEERFGAQRNDLLFEYASISSLARYLANAVNGAMVA